MKVWKKLAGVVLALAVMMSLGVSALAAEPTTAALVDETHHVTETATADGISGTSFSVAFNAGSGTGYSENTVYTYTLRNADDTAILIDDAVTFAEPTGNEYERYKVGEDNGTYFNQAKVTFPALKTAANATAVNVGLEFGTPTGTAVPGDSGLKYYVYTIKETALTNNTNSSNGKTYKLFVYVKNDGNDTPYAAILVDSNDVGTGEGKFDPAEDGNSFANTGMKQPGFTNVSTVIGVADVTIAKTVAGNNGNEDTVFNFDVTITFPSILDADATGHEWTYTVSKDGDATFKTEAGAVASAVSYSNNAATYKVTMKHGDSVTIEGLPEDTIVAVAETFTGADSGYKITSTVKDSNEASYTGATAIASNAPADEDASVAAASVTLVGGENATITVINTRDVISPTGVVLRYAPYIAMLGAGLTTMVIAPRRKEEE